ncbi:hypothetical protein BH23GEM10_BH23GEM10_11100 [soil metagenome]
MIISPRHIALLAAAALFATACKDSPSNVDPEPTVTFEIVAPRPAFMSPFVATRSGSNLTLLGTVVLPCSPFDTEADAWHDEANDALFVRFAFTSSADCEPEGNVSYMATVTNAAGSSRFRVIHEWPATEAPPDTVFKAVFSSD